MAITIGDAILWIRGNSDKLDGDLDAAGGKIGKWSDMVGKGLMAFGAAYTGAMVSLAGAVIKRGMEVKELGNEITAIMGNISGLSVDFLTSLSEESLKKIVVVSEKMKQASDKFAEGQKALQEELGVDLAEIAADTASNLEELAAGHVDRLASFAQQMTDLTQSFADKQRDIRQQLADRLADMHQDNQDQLSDLDEDYADNRKDLLSDLRKAETKEEQRRIIERIKELDEDTARRRARMIRDQQQAEERAKREAKQAEERARREFERAQEQLRKKIAAENKQYEEQTAKVIAEGAKREQAVQAQYDRELALLKKKSEDELKIYQDTLKKIIGEEIEDPFYPIKKGINEILDILSPVFMKDLEVVISFIANQVIPILKEWAKAFAEMPEGSRRVVEGLGLIIFGVGFLITKLVPFIAFLKIIFGGGGLLAGATPILTGLGAALAAISAPVWLLIAAIGALIFVLVTLGPEAANAVRMLWQLLVAGIQRIIFEIKEWGKNLGRNFASGIWEGFVEWWKTIQVNIIQAILNLIAGIQAALHPGSGFRVYADQVGAPMAQGIGMGFEQAIPALAAQMRFALAPLPAMVGGGSSIRVGKVEYHGAFSRDEMARLDRRSEKIARNTIERVLE